MASTRDTVIATNHQTSEETSTSLQFPIHHEQSSGMWLNLMEFEYQRPTASSAAAPTPTGVEVSLPIPMNLGTSYGVEWEASNFSAVQQLAVDYLRKHGGQNVNNIGAFLANPLSTISKAKGMNGGFNIGELLRGFDISKAGDQIAGAIASDLVNETALGRTIGSTVGVARNPWVAQIFTGVQFRSWTFDYSFFPNSKQESDMLEQIIGRMKYGMHPSYFTSAGQNNNNLFKYPNMYLPMLSPNKYLFEFGFCVIKDLKVDYHGEGSPVYHSVGGDKIPASIKFGFTLQEIDIVTKENLNPTGQVGGSAAVSALTAAQQGVQNGPAGTSLGTNVFKGVTKRGR